MFPGRESEFMAPELKESDVIEAMKAIPGYLDITPEDFRQLYLLALRHAWERLTRRTTAAEVMTRQVAAASADDTLDQVARIMAQEQVSGVPVLEGQRVVGVISERDFLDLAGAEKGRHFMAVLHNCLSGSSCIALPLKTKGPAK